MGCGRPPALTPGAGHQHFDVGERAPLLHYHPLSPISVAARASRARSCKRSFVWNEKGWLQRCLKPTFQPLTPWVLRAGQVSSAGVHPRWGHRPVKPQDRDWRRARRAQEASRQLVRVSMLQRLVAQEGFSYHRLHQAWLVSRHECAHAFESRSAASFTCY